MAGEKTEQPSSKRLRDAREKGDVPKSTELVSAAVVCGVVAYFIANITDIFGQLSACIDFVFLQATTRPYDESLRLIGERVVATGLSIVAPIVCITMVSALVALLIQIGLLFAPKSALPKLSNLSPKKYFQKVFSIKNLIEFLKNIIKVTVLSVVAWFAIKSHVKDALTIPESDIYSIWSVMGSLFYDLALYTVIAFGVIAALDFVYTRFKYTKDHMMSHDEVKQEFKESEGDPHIKQKRKQLHREMMQQNTLSQVRKAKVLIVNPTHYAVAIDYDPEKGKLPYVLAKGKDDLALRMIKVAEEEHIPVMREAPLARALYADANEFEYIPADLLQPVAKILALVAQMQQNG